MKKGISFAELQNEMEPDKTAGEVVQTKPTEPHRSRSNGKKKKEKVSPVSVLIDVLFIAAFAAAALFFFNPNPNKYIFGYRAYFVMTSSMVPDLPVGSLIIIHQIDPNEIQVGDDVTISTDDEEHEVITHRVVEIVENYKDSGERGFVTQGIAQSYPDEETRQAGQIIGKVQLCIPWLGYGIGFIQAHWIELTIALAAAIGLGVYLKKTWGSDASSETEENTAEAH